MQLPKLFAAWKKEIPVFWADELDVITLFVLLHRENCCRLSVGLDGSIFMSISVLNIVPLLRARWCVSVCIPYERATPKDHKYIVDGIGIQMEKEETQT